jgi:peptidoglycan hydrolase CwlO-like protein
LQQAPTYFTPPDPAIGDMLKLSEASIEQLQKARKDLEAKIVDLENEVGFGF